MRVVATRFSYPVSLDLDGRRAVVVGDDAVAQGKAGALLAAGAVLTAVAEGPVAALERLEQDERVTVLRRGFVPADLGGAFLCVAGSRDPAVRQAVFAAARARGVLLNVIDDPDRCDFAAPAVVRRGDMVIAVSTGGRSPALASGMRRLLEERFGPEWEELVALLGEVREQTLPLLPDLGERSRRWRQALELDELEALVRDGRGEEARERLLARLVGAEGAERRS
jgi:precorrin-2 dehydrogenase / sirohydrochlorin ferrochelatase